jgi:transcriptional regulator with XRE-family HTH domain
MSRLSAGSPLKQRQRHPRRPRAVSDAKLAGVIGERLKELRTHAGLSLERLSRRTGVSRGMLGQIELGRSVPTIAVLARIAAAFELPVTAFLASPLAGEQRVQVLRVTACQRLESADGKFVSRALFPFSVPRKAELYELTLSPGCSHASAAHGLGTTENLAVARGSIDVEVSGAVHELGAGDAIYFVADVPHRCSNRGAEAAIAYLVMVYPQPVSY